MAEEIKNNDTELPEESVLLEDEDGNEILFSFLAIIQHEGRPYAVLTPEDESDEEAGVVIVEIIDLNKDTEHYEAVTDEALAETIFERFRQEYGDIYDFAD